MWTVPDVTNEAKLEAAIARREGRMTLEEFLTIFTGYYGEDVVKAMRPLNWKPHPLSAYANVDKEWAEPDKEKF